MIDLRKQSNILALAVILLTVCVLAAALMAYVALLTRGAIEENQQKVVRDALKQILPAFDTAEPIQAKSADGIDMVLFKAMKDGVPIGYAVQSSTNLGYGGQIDGLIAFDLDGTLRKYVVTRHNETPGIGTKVVDRVRVRTLSDLLTGKQPPDGLPSNKVLDSYEGKNIRTAKWDRTEVDFVSGATISSAAMQDLCKRAADVLNAEFTKQEGEAVP